MHIVCVRSLRGYVLYSLVGTSTVSAQNILSLVGDPVLRYYIDLLLLLLLLLPAVVGVAVPWSRRVDSI